MKILHVNCTDLGSTGKIILDIAKYAVQRGDQCVLCTPVIHGSCAELKKHRTSFSGEQGLYRRIKYILGLRYGFAPVSTVRICRAIDREKPDVVHLHSINSDMVNIYALLRFLKKKDLPVVITNHAEFFYTGSCPYTKGCQRWKTGCGHCPNLFYAAASRLFDRTHTAWVKMRKALAAVPCLYAVSVSDYIRSRSIQSPIMEGIPQKTILNGVDTEIFHPSDTQTLRQRLQIPADCKVILHVTAMFSLNPDSVKGSAFILELAQRFESDKVLFLVVGKCDGNAPLRGNIRFLGEIREQSLLAACYSLADLYLITSREETFGMPVAEALCCGTPVAGFCAGGPESVALPRWSEFVPYGQVDQLEKIIREKWLWEKTPERQSTIADQAGAVYDSRRMAQEYFQVYETVTDRSAAVFKKGREQE